MHVHRYRCCPPEDVGGFPGYADFVDAMADPKHEKYGRMLEWYGKSPTLKRPKSAASSTTSSASPINRPQRRANQKPHPNVFDHTASPRPSADAYLSTSSLS
ncbi:IS1096 element passenger TnpR family protein [Phaeovulum sp.]|uniref:IS1096 element passenger TnpR family protein n=1 Tax=Phaeovulum sp. TaxID=2934796 RepID=UPI0039E27F36